MKVNLQVDLPSRDRGKKCKRFKQEFREGKNMICALIMIIINDQGSDTRKDFFL